MQNKLNQQIFRKNKTAFTLFEIIIALFLFALILSISYIIFNYAVQKHKSIIEYNHLRRKLNLITETIANDLSCMILVEKDFPNLEIKTINDITTISFFSSNNNEHITKGIYFQLENLGTNKQTFTKYELSASDSLFLQNTLNNANSINKTFVKYTPQTTTILSKNLFSFKIRLAIRTPLGEIFFTPPNANLTYKNGILSYQAMDKLNSNIKGTLLFMDINVSAFPLEIAQQFETVKTYPRHIQNEFLASHLCKSFRRVAPKSHCF